MKNADRVLGGILIAISIYIITTASNLVLWTTGADSAPGPGFLPMVTGVLLLLLSAILIAGTFVGKKYEKSAKTVFGKYDLKYLLTIIGSALAACLFVKFLGFIIPIGIMGGCLTYMLAENKDYKAIGMVTVILPVVLYVIFKIGLEVQLPVGIFGI